MATLQNGRDSGTLEYQADPQLPAPRGWAWFFVGTSALAAVTPWLAFTRGMSPWSVTLEVMEGSTWPGLPPTVLLLAAPFFVGTVIVLWKLYLAILHRSCMGVRVAMWAVALASLATTGWFLAQRLGDSHVWSPNGLPFGAGAGMWLLGVALAGWLWWRGRQRELAVTAALYAAYLSNAVLCLVAFTDQPDIGWWFTAAASGTLMGELAASAAGLGKNNQL